MGREEAGWSGMLYDSTPGQRRFTVVASGIAMVVASVCAGLSQVPWASWQWALMLFVAFDLGGGVAAMCLPPAIRKVRPAHEPLKPLMFAAFHIHPRSEEHTSELQSLMRISYAVFCLNKKN